MKYYLIAGEASGDLHASNLMAELKHIDDSAEFRFWGGDRMQTQGGTMVKHIRELAFMGFLEVLINIRTILQNITLCKRDLIEYRPDVLILIDYPGFNLRMASFAKKKGIRTVYYISPQIWAWNQSRVYKIKRDVDKMLVILPFEKDFYKRFGYEVVYTGHPLLDALAQNQMQSPAEDTLQPLPQAEMGQNTEPVQHRRTNNPKSPSSKTKNSFLATHKLPDKTLVAVLPGSRKQEISRMLKVMLSVSQRFSDCHFVVAGLSGLQNIYNQTLINTSNVSIVFDQTYELLKHTHAAMVVSGTATLETALLRVPQVVCYKSNTISYMIARRVVKVPYISLVNLIMDKPVVTELIQDQCNDNTLAKELDKLINDKENRQRIVSDYEMLHHKLGAGGASKRAAKEIYRLSTFDL